MGLSSRLHWPKLPQVAPERRLSKEAVLTLAIHCTYQFGASMAGLFLNLYLWRLTQDLTVNGVYNMLVFLLTPVGFAVGGWIAKRKDRMVTYRLGILSTAIFFLLVIVTQRGVADYYALFGVLNGFASGLYWIGYQVLMYDVSSDTNRIRFLGLNLVFFNSAGLAGPALAGYIIGRSDDLSGYIAVFSLSFVMFVAASLASTRIPAIRARHKAYYLPLMSALMKKNAVWFRALIAFFITGLLQGLMLFLPNILLYQTVGREDQVGYFGVFFSSLVIASGYVISRKATEAGRRKYIFWSSTGVLLGSLILLFGIHLWTFVAFMMLFSVCNPLTLNTLTSYYYRLIGSLPLKGQLRNEVVVVREVFVNAGRIISIAVLLTVSSDLESGWLPIVLLGVALLQYAIMLFIRKPQEEAQA